MGEIADAMLDGELCVGCGDYMGDGAGYSRHCSSCSLEVRDWRHSPSVIARKPYRCTQCGKRFRKEQGLRDHFNVVHTEKETGL